MSLPTYEDLMLPVLELAVRAHTEVNVPSLVPELAKRFSLTTIEIDEKLTSGKQTILSNRCHWAQIYMRRAGLLESSRRGYFKATARGRELFNENLERIDRDVLRRYPEFTTWLLASRIRGGDLAPPDLKEVANVVEITPDEQIESAAGVLNTELESKLLEMLQLVDPDQFEQIVVDLLISMGFGGGDPEMGERLGRSGDGGIDGVIRQDALGLDAVYIQAKRYRDGNTIGSPIIREFVGSLVGHRASKGVLVTSSKFTADARAFADSVQHRIVLIDGPELAQMMSRHNVGVRLDRTIVIKKIDLDYFDRQN
jgi:restriction system protein